MQVEADPEEKYRINCTRCGQSLSFNEALAATKVKCPTCKESIQLPSISGVLTHLERTGNGFEHRLVALAELTTLMIGLGIVASIVLMLNGAFSPLNGSITIILILIGGIAQWAFLRWMAEMLCAAKKTAGVEIEPGIMSRVTHVEAWRCRACGRDLPEKEAQAERCFACGVIFDPAKAKSE